MDHTRCVVCGIELGDREITAGYCECGRCYSRREVGTSPAAQRQQAHRERWERIWQAAVAILAASNGKLDAEGAVDQAEALVQEWERRKEAQGCLNQSV